MRLSTLRFVPLTLAFALAPVVAASAQEAGGVPTIAQQPSGEIQQDTGPARAPGSKAESGTAMAPASDNSGTTTLYAAPVPQNAVAWPCAQRKVSTISAGTIWSGPSIDAGKDWDQDNDVAALAQRLASRRLPITDTDPLIADFAKQAGSAKDKQLTRLFVGVLDLINTNRDQILQGIQRYAQGQERLAERMRTESDAISAKQEDATASDLGVATTQQNRDYAWDQRIFKERKQALSYVCETPSLLERRAFEIGKRIQAQL
jgi:hypothetical protein